MGHTIRLPKAPHTPPETINAYQSFLFSFLNYCFIIEFDEY